MLPEKQILAGKQALQGVRCRVGGAFLLIGLLFCVAFEYVLWRTDDLQQCAIGWENTGLWFLVQFFNFPRLVCVSLAPLAGALLWLRLALVLDALLLLRLVPRVMWIMLLHRTTRRGLHQPFTLFFLYICLIVIVAVGLVRGMRFTNPTEIQRYMWDVIVGFAFMCLAFDVLFATKNALHCNQVVASWGRVPASVLWFVLLVRPWFRQQVQSRMHRMCLPRAGTRAAAGIAGLVGSSSAEKALSKAASRFRTITLPDLDTEPEDEFSAEEQCREPLPQAASMASVVSSQHSLRRARSRAERRTMRTLTASRLLRSVSAPSVFADPDSLAREQDRMVYSRSVRSELGSCDAFVSHSWYDDREAKWEALHRWRAQFILQEGREPRLWIDRCCIKQTNTDDDLECLPFFLSGCKSLLVLGSESYLSRLWCITELVTFAHMKGGCDQIVIVPVHSGQEHEEWDFIRAGCSEFDVSDCVCSRFYDKQRIMDVIYAAWGREKGFTRVVRKLFGGLAGRSPERCSSRLAISGSDSEETSSTSEEDSSLLESSSEEGGEALVAAVPTGWLGNDGGGLRSDS